MPSVQRGEVFKRDGKWRARWYDETNRRRERSGFETKSEAAALLHRKLAEVRALRDGDVAALRRREMITVQALVDEYLSQHIAEENTLTTLTARLKHVTRTFGAQRADRLDEREIGT